MAHINLGAFRVNPRGKFSPTKQYQFLDLVSYNGAGYLYINDDTIDKVACIGIPPEGDPRSETYFMCICEKGDKGDKADTYDGFHILKSNVWDYSISDKIIIKESLNKRLQIENVYDGCCGMIVSWDKNLLLPENSDFAFDYDYIIAGTNQYYLYTFVYRYDVGGNRYMWNRTVINDGR